MNFDDFLKLFAIISPYLISQAVGNKVVFCFQEKTGRGDLTNLRQYDSSICSLCSHLTVLNTYINMDTGEIKCSNMSGENVDCGTVHVPKNNNCPPKRIVILDHHQLNENHIEKMANTSHCDIISKTIVALLQQHNLDGIYYAFKSAHDEKSSIMNLLKSLREAFKLRGYTIFYGSSNSHEGGIDQGLDIIELSSIVDFLVLDAYNFHDSTIVPERAHHHASLYNQPSDQNNKTVDFLVNLWISKHFPADKVIVTIPLWGNSWPIPTSQMNLHPPVHAQQLTKRRNGKPVNQNIIKYSDICKNVKEKKWQVFQDPNKTMGPYAVSLDSPNRIWVAYDDPAMAVTKSKYILSGGLGGAAVMYISYDDIDDACGGGPFPILTAIGKTLNESSASSTAIPIIVCFFLVVCLFVCLCECSAATTLELPSRSTFSSHGRTPLTMGSTGQDRTRGLAVQK